jgi:DNA-binding transcriptional regulator GbsR (MarR family)
VFDALRLTGERGMTLQELAHFTRRALPVVAVGVRDLHSRGVVERRIIEGIVYWSTSNRRTRAYH